MTSRPEQIASFYLHKILAQISTGSAVDDSDDFRRFQRAMERVIPSILEADYPVWASESIDALRFAVARKLGPNEAEFIGLCLLLSDQSWTPVHIRVRLANEMNNIERMACRLGEPGIGALGILRVPYGSCSETKLLYSVMDRLESIVWAYTIERQSLNAV